MTITPQAREAEHENEQLKKELSGLATSAGAIAADFNEVCIGITELFYPNVRIDGKAPSCGVVELVRDHLVRAEAKGMERALKILRNAPVNHDAASRFSMRLKKDMETEIARLRGEV